MSDLGEMREDLERGRTLTFVRRYPPPPPIEIPEPEFTAVQYARQLDRYVERRERLPPVQPQTFIDRHPNVTMAFACGTALAALWRISRYFRSEP